jgi:hypothetical protein
MVTSPPVPVSHSVAFQHSIALSMVAWSRSWFARAIEARMMSGTSATGPMAFDTSAGSAFVLSPYCANGPVAPDAPVAAPPVAAGDVPESPPLLHAAATIARVATMPMILMRFMFPLPLGRWRSPSLIARTG